MSHLRAQSALRGSGMAALYDPEHDAARYNGRPAQFHALSGSQVDDDVRVGGRAAFNPSLLALLGDDGAGGVGDGASDVGSNDSDSAGPLHCDDHPGGGGLDLDDELVNDGDDGFDDAGVDEFEDAYDDFGGGAFDGGDY